MTVYNKYKSEPFEVLAFPCNQFGAQEPGTNSEIKAFAGKYGATFPMFSKVDVNGDSTDPLFKYALPTLPSCMIPDILFHMRLSSCGLAIENLTKFCTT